MSYRFADTPPVTVLCDTLAIPMPEPSDHYPLNYLYKVFVRRPAVDLLDVDAVDRSMDVNALDNVPRSSWFTPRLGYQPITPEALLEGPYQAGPPLCPLTVISIKKVGTTPGFIVHDAREVPYLIKFDPPAFPGIETASALIVNRLFWGFGYNVPEDYLIEFPVDSLRFNPDSPVTRQDIDKILANVAISPDGIHRATASRWLDGVILGPTPDRKYRNDDPNDRIRHENLRVLRALRVFCAFTNHNDLAPDNLLDVYVGPPGQGYVKHYLLDFGGAMGSFAATHENPWSGYDHLFSFSELIKNLFTAGLLTEAWEDQPLTPWPSVGAWDAAYFQPDEWKERYPFTPVRLSQPADNYWAAKIVAALTRDHIAALVHAAHYPDSTVADYVIDTFMERRRIILEHYLHQVSPIETSGFFDGHLRVIDLGKRLLPEQTAPTIYKVSFFSASGHRVADSYQIQTKRDMLDIPILPQMLNLKTNYLRVEVHVKRGDLWLPAPAEFHLHKRSDGTTHLVGVVH